MYKLFYKNRNPYLALPSNLGLLNLLKIIKFIPAFTLKRKIYKAYVFCVILIEKKININSSQKNKNNLLLEIKSVINKNVLLVDYQFLVVWSLVDNRQRCYIYFFDQNMKLNYFAKFTKKVVDFDLLKNEYNFLLDFNPTEGNIIFNCPKAIHLEESKKYSFLVVEALASNFKLFHPENNDMPEKIFQHLNHNHVQRDLNYCFKLNWWKSFCNKKDRSLMLYNYIVNYRSNSKIKLSFIHGDLGSENTLKNEMGEFFIIDWERSSQVGPYFTDRVAFWLGKNHKKIKNNKDVLISFNEFFNTVNQLEIYLALAYLVQVDFDLAILISNKIFYDENTLR